MSLQKITMPQGGDNLTLTVTIQDTDGTAIDLSGGSVTLTLDLGNGSTTSQAGSIVTAASGICRFTLGSSGALANAGIYRARATATVGTQVMPTVWFLLDVS